MKLHKKKLSNFEIEIVHLLKELTLIENTLIQSVEGNTLIEFEGHHIERLKWNIVKLYNEAIKPFHRIHSDRFTPGIYSFMSSNIVDLEKDYRVHLLSELNRLISFSSSQDEKILLKNEIFNVVSDSIALLIRENIEIKNFCLLHGDLYNGNLLFYNNKYVLIDFEYVRFGPFQLDITFLIFWDYISESDNLKRRKSIDSALSNIKDLKFNGIINDLDIFLILDLFLPVLLCCTLQFCEGNKYLNSEEISEGIKRFWVYEYSIFKGEIV